MKAVQNKGSGAWLHTLPLKIIGIFIDDQCFQINVGLRYYCQDSCDICQKFQCG